MGLRADIFNHLKSIESKVFNYINGLYCLFIYIFVLLCFQYSNIPIFQLNLHIPVKINLNNQKLHEII